MHRIADGHLLRLHENPVAARVHKIFDFTVLLGSEEQSLCRYANATTTDLHHALGIRTGRTENCANRRLVTDTPYLDKSALRHWKDNRYEAEGGEIDF